ALGARLLGQPVRGGRLRPGELGPDRAAGQRMRVALLLACVAAPLAGQSVRSRLEGRVPAAAIPVVDSLVQAAGREGLPTEPLVGKALEGRQRGRTGAESFARVRDELPDVPPAPKPGEGTVQRARRPSSVSKAPTPP